MECGYCGSNKCGYHDLELGPIILKKELLLSGLTATEMEITEYNIRHGFRTIKRGFKPPFWLDVVQQLKSLHRRIKAQSNLA